MTYRDIIRSLGRDPEQLELAYQAALKAGEGDAFAEAMRQAHAEAPDDVLYAAWRHRLAHVVARARDRIIAWRQAVPLAVLNALALWFLSGDRFYVRIDGNVHVPGVLLLAAPVSALAVLAFLVAAGGRRARRAVLAGALLALLAGYAWFVHARIARPIFEEQYVQLMALHLPLLAWSGVGLYALGFGRDAAGRFAFLVKSLEVFVAGGLFGIACGLFVAISMGMFEAIAVDLPQVVERLFVAGGAGLVPVLAVAICYDPKTEPGAQSFDEGLSRFIATLMRVLLPLTLVVLIAYLVLIPLNFRAAFEDRDVLIVYNAMLFAVIALLVGATPLPGAQPAGRTGSWLRHGLVLVATLALAVGAYALAAIAYRTARDVLTPNRLAFIGWNVVNLGVLLGLLLRAWRARRADGFSALRESYALATVPYAAWALIVLLVVPWLFAAMPKGLDGLPEPVRDIVLREPGTVLLKCADRPEIYLLENGRKRWIRDIATFEAEGYAWDDVHTWLDCADLRRVPDGVPIPPDAGAPPASPSRARSSATPAPVDRR